MSEKLKCESHFERRNRSPKYKSFGQVICTKFVTEQKYDAEIDRVVSVTKLQSYKPHDNFKNYRVSDFALDTILSVGATDMLQPAPAFGNINIDNAVDNAQVMLETISNQTQE